MRLFTRGALARTGSALVLCAAAALAAPRSVSGQTALDRYVHAPDSHYRYQLVSRIPGQGYTAFVLDMTSQQWRRPSEVDRSIWKHWLIIIKPDQVRTTTALLFINGGSNDGKVPNKIDPAWSNTAVTTGSVVADLRMIPNEPLTFSDDHVKRTEDAIIAYTWDKYLRTGDESWPLRLPMTKAAVRAMDTVTAFCGGSEAGGVKVDHFFVAGGSKRGWTTWTTAAVDQRVIGINPFVIDLLNIVPSFEHHWRVYGFWAPAIKDYEDMGIMDWTGTPQYAALMKLVEPYSYRDRFTMPKLLINAAGDQFFLPDSSQFYFNDLPGEKYLRYVPNADHSLKNSDALESMVAFYDALLNHRPRPRFSWQFEKNGDIRVVAQDKPAAVKLWQATNAEHRDFRLESIGPAYRSTALADRGDGVYVGHVAPPDKGWTAYFVELTFPSQSKYPFKFTTGVRVAPDTLPFPPFVPKTKH